MPLEPLRTIVDFGLVVLIWLVQLIIYPGFHHCDPQQFQAWHHRYTGRITLVVAPLMFSQLGLVAWQCWTAPRLASFLSLLLVGLCWLATFLVSVPCHQRLQTAGLDRSVVARLVSTNWIRTAAWTGILLIGAVDWLFLDNALAFLP